MIHACPTCKNNISFSERAQSIAVIKCGLCGHVLSEPPAKPPRIKPRNVFERANHWFTLHRYAHNRAGDWIVAEAEEFVRQWVADIPKNTPGVCNCYADWLAFDHRFDCSSREAFQRSCVDGHNLVRSKLGQSLFTYEQAVVRWAPRRRTGVYSAEPLPNLPPIDVIIPFGTGYEPYLRECVDAILCQRFVTLRVHVIADFGAEFPQLPDDRRIAFYRSTARVGPYVITNAIVRQYCDAPLIAVQDSDDISLPDRLWKQADQLTRYGYEMTSCAMENFADSYNGRRHKKEPIVKPWTVYSSVPRGRMVNGTRMVTRDAFLRLGGFAHWPCSADFDFDNRALFCDIPTFGSMEILGRRRLHNGSLTNASEYRSGSALRKDFNSRIMRNLNAISRSPNEQTARRLVLDEALLSPAAQVLPIGRG